MKFFKNLLLVTLFFATVTAFGQIKIKGVVIDETGLPLLGASIVEKGTTNGTTTDFEGKFTLKTKANKGIIVIYFVGYTNKKVSFHSSKTSLGKIKLETSNTLDEVVVNASGVIDLAEDRKTPIAVSTIKANEIQSKAGNFDLPEVLKSTPSVQNIKGGGFGDGQMFLRGFDQSNTAFMLNGQPINGVEDGKMYWSNWSGVLDVADVIQVQRGLGSSKLAISSVGGTVNIVTKTIDKKRGGYIQQMIANNNYIKTTAYYSTGVSEKGWSFSTMLGHWQGNGYVNYTNGQGQTYFFSVGYKPNENNTLNFLLTGAPQWHAVAGRGTIKKFLDNGIRYNSWNEKEVNSPNTLGNSNVYPGGRNIYHKPVANLTWDWTINENSSLSSVLYGSLGRGAFVSEKITNGNGYAKGIFNNHSWYGIISNFSTELNENLTLNGGIDIRLYNGVHFRGVSEFIGTNYLTNSNERLGSYTITNTYGGISPWGMVFNPNKNHNQRLDYDYEEDINYYGLFTQLEYSQDYFSVFFQGSISNQNHQKTDYYNYKTIQKTKNISNFGYNVKGGVAYEINENSKIFANGGFYSRQPFHDNLFLSIRNSNDLLSNVKNQDILGLEAGYQFKSEFVSANLNIYNTKWKNRTVTRDNRKNFDTPDFRQSQTSSVTQLHRGVELEVFTNPFEGLKLNGFLSVGNWKYKGNGTERVYDTKGKLLSTTIIKPNGNKVGGAAQTTGGVSANYMIVPKLTFDANWNWYGNLYSQGSIASKSIKLPSYNTTDLGLSYKPKLKEVTVLKTLEFRVAISNVFDEMYLESLSQNKSASTNPTENYKGININNQGRFGYGRTWNVSVRFNF